MDDDPTPDRPSAQDLLEHLLARHSVGPRRLRPPGPGDAELLLAARVALRAPDHHQRVPFRFVVVPDDARPALARLFEQAARRRGADAGEVRAEGERACNGPALVALLARIDADDPLVPAHEQWICVGGALAGFMNALHLMGFGAKMLSGRKAADPAIAAAFCAAGERLVGWIAIGTPASVPQPKGRDDAAAVLRRWHPPGADASAGGDRDA